MKDNFWKTLKKPIFCVAPLEDVTDAAFRYILAKIGKPDILWTEFTSVDGLVSDEGRAANLVNFQYDEIERPIVAQIFGNKPENFHKVASMVADLGFDGIDINFGCPDESICKKQHAGSWLIQEPERAKEIILATKEGSKGLPVSVKTRTGYNKSVVEQWAYTILETKPAALTMHGRTRKEMSKVPANWEDIAKVVQVRDEMKSDAFIIGNGDVTTLEEAEDKVNAYGVDGVMIGRGIFANPWLFSGRKIEDIGLEERLETLLEHTRLFDEFFGESKNFLKLRKHFSNYVRGLKGAKQLRMALVNTKNRKEVEDIVKAALKK